MSKHSDSEEIPEPEHQVDEEDTVSSEDDYEPERLRCSTRARQPRCILACNELGKSISAHLRK